MAQFIYTKFSGLRYNNCGVKKKFDIRGLAHHEFVKPGTIVNSKFYSEVLKQLKHRVKRVRPDIAGNWRPHRDNAPAHTAFIVSDYLVKSKVPTIPQIRVEPGRSSPAFFIYFHASKHLRKANISRQ